MHTSVYDIQNRTLRIAVQEIDDWYTFSVPSTGGGKVKSVNGKDGEVVLDAADVHALPDTYTPPIQPTDTNTVREIVKPMIEDATASVVKSNAVGEAEVKTLRFTDENSIEALAGTSTIIFKRSGTTWSAFGGTSGGINAFALGNKATAEGTASLAIGRSASALGHQSIAIGVAANARHTDSLVITDKLLLSEDEHTINFGFTDDPNRIYFDNKTLASMIHDEAPSPEDYISATNEVFGSAVRGVVNQQYIREKLEVYLYVGEDSGIYVHTN